MRAHIPSIAGTALGLTILAWLGLADFSWTDYDSEAAPAFRALLHGHFSDFLALAPAYGGSLLLRAPAAALPALWGGGEVAAFRAGSLVGLGALGVLAVCLDARLRALGRSRLVRGSVAGLCVGSPVTLKALEVGHPEELIGAVLCVPAVLVAARGRTTWAAVLLGLAIATKAWGVLAIGPVLIALPAQRVRALVIAGALAAALTVPLILAQPDTFVAKSHGAARTGTIFTPWQAWWFLGDADVVVRGVDGQVKPGFRQAPDGLDLVPRLLIVGLAVPLTLILGLARRRPRRAGDAVLLLALLLHLRCVLDTWNFSYYAMPFLLALTCWEGLYRRRPPVVALASTCAIWAAFEKLPALAGPDATAAVYLAGALPLAAGLAAALYVPDSWRQMVPSWLRLDARESRRRALVPGELESVTGP